MIEKKLKYPQPHSIKIPINLNEMLKDRLIEYEHAKAKYQAKYLASKRNRRNYE